MSSYGNNFKASSVEVDVLKTRERFCTFGVAPATAYSVGVVGDVRYVRTGAGAGYIYVCTAKDEWGRAAIASWGA